MSSRRLIASTIIAIAWPAVQAGATPMIDQHHTLVQSVGGTLVYNSLLVGQTLTVGQAGTLSRVDLTLGTIGSPTNDVQFEIRNVAAGVPTSGQPLYQTMIPLSSIPPRGGPSSFPFVPVDVSGANLSVPAGEQLALVVTRNAPHGFENTVVWERGLPGYSAGASMSKSGTQAWSVNSTPYDYGFRTWIEPPSVGPQGPGPSYRLFETTRPLPPNDTIHNGLTANDQRYPGVNFDVVRPTRLRSIGAQFVGGAPGQVFGAVVKLNDINGAPNPPNLTGSDVLATTLINLPNSSAGPVDAFGDVDVLLEPGIYGLYFGSGRFGASGNGFLYSENDPTGAWAIWSIQQPSGNRNFLSSNVRLFIDASSTPGSVQLRPQVDAAGEQFSGGVYSIDNTDARIELDSTPFGSVAKRGILEFDISHIPANAVIESATLDVDTNGRSSNGISDPQMKLYGYAGDGAATPVDMQQLSTVVGTSPALDDLGMFSVNIDPAFVQSMLGSDYLGLLATSANPNSSIDFYPTENHGHGEAPLLTIVLSVPGDFDGDLNVGGRDFLAWQRGESPTPLSAIDLAAWKGSFGGAASATALAEVPEPSGAMLAVLAVIATAGRLAAKFRGG